MNFSFLNSNSSKEKLMTKNVKTNNNNTENTSNKTSSVRHFLPTKKENQTSSYNTLDNSQVKENEHNNILYKNYEENKVKLMKKNTNTKSIISTKLKRKTLRMPFPRNTIIQIETLKHINDNKTKVGLNQIKIRICDFSLAFLSLVSIFCAFLDNSYFISKSFDYLEKKYGYKPEDLMNKTNEEINFYANQMGKRKISPIENLFRCLNLISSFLCCIILFIKYYCKIDLLKIDKKISEYDNYFTSGICHYLIIECLICIISYPPKINKVFHYSHHTVKYTYSLNSIILTFSFFKLYNFFRILFMASQYSSRISETICQTYNIYYGLLFMIRGEVNSRPIFFCGICFLIFIMISTILLRSLEVFGYDIRYGLNGNKGNNDLRVLANNFWLSIITITGIGYGDEYPRTNLGRIVIFISSIFGMFFLGFLIANISGASQFNSNEGRAYLKMEKILSNENLQHKSAELIKGLLFVRRNFINYKNKLGDMTTLLKERMILFCKFHTDYVNFNDELYVARYYSIPMVNLIKSMEYKLYENLSIITKQLDRIDFIDKKLYALEKGQNEIVSSLKNVNFLQNKITKFLLEKHNNNYLKRNDIQEVDEEEEKEKEETDVKLENNKSLKKNIIITEINNEETMGRLELFVDSNKFTKSVLSKPIKETKSILTIPKISPRKHFISPRIRPRNYTNIKNKTKSEIKKNIVLEKLKKKLFDNTLKKFNNLYKLDTINEVEVRKARSYKNKKIKI